MKQTKKALSLLLAAVLLLASLSAGSVCLAAARGECGENLVWILDDNGLLTISGSGTRMTDASTWSDHAAEICFVKFNCIIENIGAGSFEDCVNLKSVTIPDGVKRIGVQAFRDCKALESVTLPDSVETISSKAFLGCKALKSITVPEKVTSLQPYLFEDCTSLKSVTLPQGLTEIDFAAFRGCVLLRDVYFGGTRAQWNDVTVEDGNNQLQAATIHCADDESDDSKPFFSRVIEIIRQWFERLLGWFIRK